MRGILFLGLSLLLANAAAAVEPRLTVQLPGHQQEFSAEQFAALPHHQLTATDPHAKVEHHYHGVLVRDLLTLLGAPAGEKIRGTALQLAVLVRGSDGYATVFSLAELDDAYGQRTLLLADRDEKGALDAHFRPLRLIVPGDQHAARWVRNVISLELVTVGSVVPRPNHP